MDYRTLELYKKNCSNGKWKTSTWEDVKAFETELKTGKRNTKGKLILSERVRRTYGWVSAL